jgi:hypothetical protein
MRTGISKLLTSLFYLLCCAALVWASGLSALNRPFPGRAMKNSRANTVPTIDKTSIQVTTRRHTAYLGNAGRRRDETTWSWTPRISFRVNGPIASGSQLAVEFLQPGGTPWVTFDSPTRAIGADEWWQVDSSGNDLSEEFGSLVTGPVDFKILLRYELEGSRRVLFTGKANVKKFHVGNDLPAFKNNFDFYVDQDWNLPIGYVFATEPIHEGSSDSYTEFAPLCTSLWFRGDPPGKDLSAHLFYKGKEISNTGSQGEMNREILNSSFEESPHIWSRQCFSFSQVLVFNKEDPDHHAEAFRLDKNPGDYEIKVMRRGHLVRVLKFRVGSDGKLVDTGVAAQNVLGTRRLVVPVKVLGAEDGTWDSTAWKTGAFYGNRLANFASE